ncbi:MAG: redoxin domain-containing protein, partial [Spirochaetales bacterium]|nr:redoxin domain-containing protein [Spirochaetales bacterium]
MLETGTKAPDFELQDQNGKTHRLSDYQGKKVILYF